MYLSCALIYYKLYKNPYKIRVKYIIGGPSRIRTNDQGVAVPCLSHLAIGPSIYYINFFVIIHRSCINYIKKIFIFQYYFDTFLYFYIFFEILYIFIVIM